jgi:hypothetical protein
VEASFFDLVLDIVEGFVADVPGQRHATAHRGGVKVWFDDATREHYEAQLIRVDGSVVLEIGFHAEHPKPQLNEIVLDRIRSKQRGWKQALGDEPVAGEFIGRASWRRVSETWPVPDVDDVDATIEVAARLADYIHALEPIRRG